MTFVNIGETLSPQLKHITAKYACGLVRAEEAGILHGRMEAFKMLEIETVNRSNLSLNIDIRLYF